jgi:3-hydroxy acid dehydrogenase/malonic semialdehyde reductase
LELALKGRILHSMPSVLANKWVVITGASSGFGAAAAKAFAAQGAKLFLGARREDRLKQVVTAALKAGSPEAHYHFLDVAETSSVEQFVAAIRQRTSKIDVLINNAGGAKGLDKIADAKDEDWEFMVQTNVLGVLRITRACIPLMTNNPGSSILNIGSIAGHTAYEGGAAYCAAKAGELKITQALRLELCGTGVRVGTVDPGFAETEFSLVRFKGDAERAKKVYEGTNPLTGEDIAETLVWVASRPAHVNIDEVLIKPTDQAAIHKVHRRTA